MMIIEVTHYMANYFNHKMSTFAKSICFMFFFIKVPLALL